MTTTDLDPLASRVLILGWDDGATDGVIELGRGWPVQRFELDEDAHNPAGCDSRTYTLRPLPADALDRLAAVIGEHVAPQWPVWCPLWRFPTADIAADVTARVDAILAEAGEELLRLETDDTATFRTIRVSPLAALVVG